MDGFQFASVKSRSKPTHSMSSHSATASWHTCTPCASGRRCCSTAANLGEARSCRSRSCHSDITFVTTSGSDCASSPTAGAVANAARAARTPTANPASVARAGAGEASPPWPPRAAGGAMHLRNRAREPPRSAVLAPTAIRAAMAAASTRRRRAAQVQQDRSPLSPLLQSNQFFRKQSLHCGSAQLPTASTSRVGAHSESMQA